MKIMVFIINIVIFLENAAVPKPLLTCTNQINSRYVTKALSKVSFNLPIFNKLNLNCDWLYHKLNEFPVIKTERENPVIFSSWNQSVYIEGDVLTASFLSFEGFRNHRMKL